MDQVGLIVNQGYTRGPWPTTFMALDKSPCLRVGSLFHVRSESVNIALIYSVN